MTQETNTETSTGTSNQEQAPEVDQTLLDIPEIGAVVRFYQDTIKTLKARTDLEPFTKKLKLKPLLREFEVVVIGLKGMTRVMKQLEIEPENTQHQEDLKAIGTAFAERCQTLMRTRKITLN